MAKISAGDIEKYIEKARLGVNEYLDREVNAENIDKNYYDMAVEHVMPNIRDWLEDEYDENYTANVKEGIMSAIDAGKWDQITEAFVGAIKFGTGGIRGKMAFDRESILKLKEEGIDAPILKGPNTLNDKVLLLKSVGVAQFAQERGLKKVVIGYDSRVRGLDFAKLITKLFLAFDLQVYLFDEACPYPEVTFAVPNLKADIGILISASHNDYRYNGYKLSCGNGSQFDLKDRNYIYDKFIVNAKSEQIKLRELEDAGSEQLWFLGGKKPQPDFDYAGHGQNLIDMHSRHIDHVKKFLLIKEQIAEQKDSEDGLKIGFSAFHGAGRNAVPRLLTEVGFSHIQKIKKLDELNGMFPCFNSDPGEEQQPDPGDPRAAEIAVNAFKEEYPGEFENIDILIGTDPDADRCGIVIKVPEDQQDIYDNKNYTLLPADYAWAVLLWYRLKKQIESGELDPETGFITLSHTTSDLIIRVAQKFGLGAIKTWVGFAMLANSVQMVWEGVDIPEIKEGRENPEDKKCNPVIYNVLDMHNGKRSFNVGALEQSNGFSILGGKPKDAYSLGEQGHVRDKDGTFAALLLAEISAYAKSQNKSLLEILDEEIYLDPDIGLFINYYEPAPKDGEYEGLAGYSKKKRILTKAIDLHQKAQSGDVTIAGMKVKKSLVYLTGKYDAQNWPGFPDEGIRFYFDDEEYCWLHIRPSGTSNALRFHTQLRDMNVNKDNLKLKKKELMAKSEVIVSQVREILEAIE